MRTPRAVLPTTTPTEPAIRAWSRSVSTEKVSEKAACRDMIRPPVTGVAAQMTGEPPVCWT
jgi:hypothetical protein